MIKSLAGESHVMPDERAALFSRTIYQLEQCLAILQEAHLPSPDLEFLQLFLTHATRYLAKDVSSATEALENWDTTENQAMIGRYITHLELEIQLLVAAWQQTHVNERDRPLRDKLTAMLTTLEGGLQRPT